MVLKDALASLPVLLFWFWPLGLVAAALLHLVWKLVRGRPSPRKQPVTSPVASLSVHHPLP